jgi:Zn-dependent protease with chaperone function
VILPYLARLLCLGLASFFLVHLVTALFVAAFTPHAIRAAQELAPRRAARLLLTLRLSPFGLALTAVLGLCLPSYFWFEPDRIDEQVGVACLFFALMGAIIAGLALARGVRAIVATLLFARRCRRSGSHVSLAGKYPRATVIEGATPLLALAGIVRPRLIVSEGVVNALSEEELSVALRHERAHQTSRDNLKRLCIFLTPGMIPLLPGFRALERGWISFAEYAADEAAVAGDTRRSLALASALVRVARLGSVSGLSPVAISFLEDVSDLSARVDRLLLQSPLIEAPHRMPWYRVGSLLILSGCVAPMFFKPSTFRFVQSLLERLIH